MTSFAHRTLSQSTRLALASGGALAGVLYLGLDVTEPLVTLIMGGYLGAFAAGVYTASKYRVIPGTPIRVVRRD